MVEDGRPFAQGSAVRVFVDGPILEEVIDPGQSEIEYQGGHEEEAKEDLLGVPLDPRSLGLYFDRHDHPFMGLKMRRRIGNKMRSPKMALITVKLMRTPIFWVNWKLEKRKMKKPTVRIMEVIRMGLPTDRIVL
jgi:hypothetical protein